MKRSSRIIIATLTVLPLLGGCQTNEQTGGLVGAGSGAVLGGVLGNALGRSPGAMALGATLGGVGGYLVGSSIGRQLDERDRQRAEMATRQALAAPAYYPAPSAPPRPPATVQNWSSQDNAGVRGSSTVVAVQRQSSGGECRTVKEVAYIKGDEVVQNTRYCQDGSGSWQPQT